MSNEPDPIPISTGGLSNEEVYEIFKKWISELSESEQTHKAK